VQYLHHEKEKGKNMAYQLTEQDIVLARRQNDELIDDAVPHSIVFSYDDSRDKKWQLIEINLTEEKKVAIRAVRKSFDLGDGYYTMNVPEEEDYLVLELDLTDSFAQDLVERTLEKWQNSQITMGFIHPDRLSDVDIWWLQAVLRRGWKDDLIKKLYKKIDRYKQNETMWKDEIKEFESLIALLNSANVYHTLDQKLTAYQERVRRYEQDDPEEEGEE
jgi:hypothetical protein